MPSTAPGLDLALGHHHLPLQLVEEGEAKPGTKAFEKVLRTMREAFKSAEKAFGADRAAPLKEDWEKARAEHSVANLPLPITAW